MEEQTMSMVDTDDSAIRPEAEHSSSKESRLALIHARMYAVGDRYLIPGLKVLAQTYFGAAIVTLRGMDWATVIKEVYTNTPDHDRGLRDLVLTKSTNMVAELVKGDGFKAVAIDVPQFWFELLQRTVAKVDDQKVYCFTPAECVHCQRDDAAPSLYCRHNCPAKRRKIL